MNTIYAIIKEDTTTASCNITALYLAREDAVNEILSLTNDIIDEIFDAVDEENLSTDWGWNLADHIGKYTTIQLAELDFIGGKRCEIMDFPDVKNEIDFDEIHEIALQIAYRQDEWRCDHRDNDPVEPDEWRPGDAPWDAPGMSVSDFI